MALSHVGTTSLASGTTSASPTLTASWRAGDLALVCISSNDATNTPQNIPTVSLSTYILVGSFVGGTGSQGLGSGLRRSTVYYKVLAIGDAAPTVALTNGNVMSATISVWRSDSVQAYEMTSSGGQDTSTGSGYSATVADVLDWSSGDVALWITSTSDGTNGNSARSISATGATFGSATLQTSGGSATGNTVGVSVNTASCTAGPATAAATVTETLSVSSDGCSLLVRIREVSNVFGSPYTYY